jgi:hypothetical protein
MTALSTEARQLVQSALTAAGIDNYSAPPTVPKPGMVVVMPDLPWLDIERIGSRLNYVVRHRLLLLLDGRSNTGAQLQAEDLAEEVLEALPSAFRVTYVGPPTVVDIGSQGGILAVEMSIQVSMKE